MDSLYAGGARYQFGVRNTRGASFIFSSPVSGRKVDFLFLYCSPPFVPRAARRKASGMGSNPRFRMVRGNAVTPDGWRASTLREGRGVRELRDGKIKKKDKSTKTSGWKRICRRIRRWEIPRANYPSIVTGSPSRRECKEIDYTKSSFYCK